MSTDLIKVKVGGVNIVDTITNVKTGKVDVIKRDHNIVVDTTLKLIMGMLKGSLKGIQYWAVGKGLASWDNTPVQPLITEDRLTTELGRKPILASSIVYVNPDTYEVSSTPTNCLSIGCTFDETECNGEWREFGIFGGNATADKDSGFMIDKKHHSVFTKTEDMVVDRKLYLTISF